MAEISAVSNCGWNFGRHLWKTPSWKINAVAQQKCRQSDWEWAMIFQPMCCIQLKFILFERLICLSAQTPVATISKPVMPMKHGRIRTFDLSQTLSQDPLKIWFQDVRNPCKTEYADSRRNTPELRQFTPELRQFTPMYAATWECFFLHVFTFVQEHLLDS